MNCEELQAVMDDKGWSQSELARQIGTSPEVVSRWLHGKAKMSDAKDRELRRVLSPKEGEDNEVKQLLREKIILLERMLEDRDAEVERLKKRQNALDLEGLPPVLETAGSRGRRVNG